METQTFRDLKGRVFYFVLLAIVASYAVHLLAFTVFEGFATFSNDAASYVLMARKWSPYFAPTVAEVFTTPFHDYPPVFPLLLAVTGASDSLWASHLVVSLCLLASLIMIGVFLRSRLPAIQVFALLVAFCALPGVVINSLGILSENLYLLITIAALTIYSRITVQGRTSWVGYAVLLALVSSAILTRTVGVSLAVACCIAPLFNSRLPGAKKIALPLLGGASLLIWRAWEVFGPQTISLSYLYVSDLHLFAENPIQQAPILWQSAVRNMFELLFSWNNYLFLNNFSPLMFALGYLVLIVCATCLGLRIVRCQFDAIYIVCYVGILLIWPYPEEMGRFLHPIVWLVLAQPALYLFEGSGDRDPKLGKQAFLALLALLIVCTSKVQIDMIKLREEAVSQHPRLAHAVEYYDDRFGAQSVALAHFYGYVSNFMQLSSEQLSERSVVASVKHENFALFADRPAVTLSAVVSIDQQLCNFKLQGVDAIFLTGLTSSLNSRSLASLEDYRPYAREVLPMESEAGSQKAYLLLLDKSEVERGLKATGFQCDQVRYIPSSG